MLRKSTLAVLLGVGLALGSQAHAETATATLKDGSGKAVGTATLTDTPSGLLIKLILAGVPAGEHAFHIHAVGKCDAPDFKSAGDHFNPTNAKHGLMNPAGPHEGDMPNIYVPAGGKLEIEVLNPKVTVAALHDANGSALVIHASADDYKTDPAGNAGNRIACGVVTP
jgi:Cu-Zn family superoxide dismutase